MGLKGKRVNAYECTINKIVNGYRFPSDVSKHIYEVYGDYIYRLESNTPVHFEYMKILKGLCPDWKPKKTTDEIVKQSYTKPDRTIFRYNLKGDLMKVYSSAKEASDDTGYPVSSIEKACDDDNYKSYKSSYWYYRMIHPKVKEKILNGKATFSGSRKFDVL